MRADIPDSIIISRDEDGVLHHSYWTTDQQLVPFEATKFIRKDALIEWLMDEMDKSEKFSTCEHYSNVVEHLEEM